MIFAAGEDQGHGRHGATQRGFVFQRFDHGGIGLAILDRQPFEQRADGLDDRLAGLSGRYSSSTAAAPSG